MTQQIAFSIALLAAVLAGIVVPRILSRSIKKAFPGKDILKGEIISTDARFIGRIAALASFWGVFLISK